MNYSALSRVNLLITQKTLIRKYSDIYIHDRIRCLPGLFQIAEGANERQP